VNLKPQEVATKVPELRQLFKTKYADEIRGGEYDLRDLARLENDDAYARCFLRCLLSKGDVGKSVPLIDECFKFRKEFQINDLSEASFPREMIEKRAIYYKGKDKDGHPIVYLRTKENAAENPEHQKLMKKYIAYTFEQHHKKSPEEMIVCLIDMSGAGLSNMNLDISKFILHCFSTYFPAILAYMINYEMPFLLNAVWTLITPFLNSDQKKKLILAGKKDIGKYINDEHLWDHMKKKE